MASKSAKAVDAALGDLPIDDRVAALVCSLITRKPQAVSAILSLCSLIAIMTSRLDLSRMMVAEVVRDFADEIEHVRHLEKVAQ
jgi:hypothetical protein